MYRAETTIEAATYLLARSGGEMPYIKLIKLLYLADREMLKRYGRTLTGDTHWSLKYGPVLEHTLDIIKTGDPSWNSYMETDSDAKMISLIAEAVPAELSRGAIDVLEFVLSEYGHMKWPDLIKYTHSLAEWTPVTSGRKRIHLEDMARAVGHGEKVEQILLSNSEREEIAALLDPVKRKTVHV